MLNNKYITYLKNKKETKNNETKFNIKNELSNIKIEDLVEYKELEQDNNEILYANTKDKQGIKDGKKVRIYCNYNPALIELIKTLDGRKYDPKTKTWTCTIGLSNLKNLKTWGFNLDEELETSLYKLENILIKQDKKYNNFDINSIKVPKGLSLMPFQSNGVAFIESRNGNAIIGDEMGLGKTITALAYVSNHPELSPVIIVVPATLKYNWKAEAEKWLLTKRDIQVLEGKKSKKLKKSTDIIIINYDIISSWVKEIDAIKPKILIADEAHMIKNNSAKRTKAVKRIARKTKHVLPLSGTPAINRPSELYNAISLVEPNLFASFQSYAQRYCNPTYNGFGWDYSGASNLDELYSILSNIMLRRKKEEVLTDLPDKRYSYIKMDLNNKLEYDRAENDFISWVRENKGKRAAQKASQAETLVKISALRQLAVQGSLSNCIEWIKDFIDGSDEKLVVFAVHKFVIAELENTFKDICVKIDGSVATGETRQNIVNKFQTDKKIRLFIGNITAAGVGITLTAASNVAFIELPWTPGDTAQCIDRCHRIGQKNAVNVWYLLPKDTIETKLAEMIDSKRNVLSKVLDGKEIDDENSMISNLMKGYE
jgi:SWI/SNF-related matrix-associated actin-dependent regulator 1 of chromatin subfamily A